MYIYDRKKSTDCGKATDVHLLLHPTAAELQQENKALWPNVNSAKESV